MIGDAIIKMITALTRKRFKCKSGYNPFSYFTKVAYRAFQNRIKKEKKEHDTIHRYQNEIYSLLTESGQIPFQKNSKFDTEYDDSFRPENA
jgi:DNA-directed RNA polymerase specialized sigma24 family protein